MVGVFTATLAAQSVELYPYAGGFWPSRVDDWGNNKLKSEGIYGLKGGVFLTENAEVEGSFGYINHFEMRYAPNPVQRVSFTTTTRSSRLIMVEV